MQPAYGAVAALAVIAIYYVWRCYFRVAFLRERTLRRRVAYMLWTMANREAIDPDWADAGGGLVADLWEPDLSVTPAPRV